MRKAFQLSAIVALNIMTATSVFAAGFEKNIMWSGRHASVGGTAISYVEGSEAIYFNPAGLVTSRPGGMDVSLNVSPTQATFEGPFQNNVISKSEKTFVPFGVTAAYTLGEKIGLGAGVYVSGGAKAEYKDVTVNPAAPTIRPTFKTDLELVEVALGGAYEIFDGLKLGAAWRAGFVSADFWSASQGATFVEAQFSDLTDENFAGFRLGAQWAPSETWGVGVSYRSEFKFDTEGNVTGKSNGSTIPGSAATATTYFPQQVGVGGHWQALPGELHLALEYSMTEYSKNQIVDFGGTLAGQPVSDVTLNWKDMTNVRLGLEYLRLGIPVRLGYVFTSQVVPESHARPTLTAPGIGHTVTIGSGHGFWEKRLMVNAGFEYSWIEGEVTANPLTNNDPRIGSYSSTGMALHTGLTYMF